MKKLLLVLATSVFVAATNVNAQSVKAYKNGNATDYTASGLKQGDLSTVDSIVATGTWTNQDIENLSSSFTTGMFSDNTNLKNADFSNAVFTANSLSSLFYHCKALKSVVLPNTVKTDGISLGSAFSMCVELESIKNLDKLQNITNMYCAFQYCKKISSITLPNVTNNNEVSFQSTFSECNSLLNIDNLDKFTNITCISSMFYDCRMLKSVTFSNVVNSNEMDAYCTFYWCDSLKTLTNFEKFTGITSMVYSFYGCKKIDEIHFGCIPSAIQSSDNPFYICNAYKYLPSGITSIPTEWQSYTNFVLPFTSVTLEGNMSYSSTYPIELPTISTNPSYCGATEIVCQISNDNFATSTTIGSNAILKGNYTGYKFRIAAKNELMNSYVYSNSVDVVASPYQATAYVNGKPTRYKISQIYLSTFADADSLVLEGAWTNSNFSTLRGALKEGENYYTSTNDKLMKIDMSNVILSGNMSLGVSDLFRFCENLTKVILPEQESTVDFSLYGTFSGCSKLETIENLDKIKNITDLRETFKDCHVLKSLEFSESTNSKSIALYNTFYNCKSLESITNFEKFTNLYDFSYAFYGCSALKQIAFGTNPNTDNAKKICNSNSNNAFSYTFTNCNAIKSLPNGVSTIPSSWQGFNNFVLPFTSASLSGTAGFNTGDVFVLPTINPTPAYCAATDIVYELSNDGFATKETYTPNTIVTKDYTGYKMRLGAKNASMDSYVYSSSMDVTKVNFVLTAYTTGVASKYGVDQLETGTLAQVDSIVVYGSWNDGNLSKLQKALKSDGKYDTYNLCLKGANMSNATFNGDIINGMYGLFRSCDSLKYAILPSNAFSGTTYLLYTFKNCENLKRVGNLDKLLNISKMEGTFSGCKKLVNVKFAKTKNTTNITLTDVFDNCSSLESADLSSFKNISGLYGTFNNCSALKTVTFADTANNNSIYLYYTFSNCGSLKTITNFKYFSNLCDFNYSFYSCKSLKELEIGTDPNTDNAKKTYWNSDYPFVSTFSNCKASIFLPSTVTTIPEKWQSYTNFVLPITSIEISGTATIDKQGGEIATPTITNTPKYCIATDTVYLVSNNNFTTSKSFAPGDVIPATYIGYQVKVGVKNARMTDYVYSPTLMTIATAATVIAYTGGKSTTYSIADLTTGSIASADSIVVEGSWNNDNLIKLQKALKTDGNTYTPNHSLKNANMADATFIGDITDGMDYMFRYCDSLKNVSLSSSVFTGKISLYYTFNGCSKLVNIKNLDKLQNITDLYYTFYNCGKITNVKFADTENKNTTSLEETFCYCSSLESVDLSSFKNITSSLYETFYKCTSLKNVKFADAENINSIRLDETFCGCTALQSLTNFEKFTNLYGFEYAFKSCSSLKEVKLGTDPNTDNAKKTYWSSDTPFTDAFTDCNAIKYLPDTVKKIPVELQTFNNFVLPITSVTQTGTAGITKEGGVMSTPSIAASPAYCAITDTIYQLSNNNFSTYKSFKKGEVLKDNYVGYQLRVGVKNQSMANYVYSSASIKVEEIIPLIAYRNDTATEYSFSAIKPGILADAERIELYGAWTDTDLLNLQKALKKNWSTQNNEENSTLVNADLSKVSFSGNVCNTSRLFKNCTALIEVQLPSATIANGISLSSTFSGCTLLKYVLNLEKLDNIVKIDSAFYNCKTISSLKFSTTAMTAKIDFAAAFYGCSSLSAVTNLASFQNICGLTYAFANCKSLFSSLYFSQITNKNSIDATGAFDGSYVSSIYYFNYFENITNLSYTFRNCNNLGSITLGVDPNKLAEANIVGTFDGCSSVNKYLPDGVDTIPTIWQKANYNNFAVPIKSIDADIVAYITEDGEAKVNLQSCTTNPSYALCDWTNWKFSNDNFATTSSSLSNMTAGFKAVYGVKNNSMSDYIYSDTATATTLSTNIIVYRGKSKSTYTASTLENGLLSDADSIVLEGSWYDDNLGKLQKALKTDGSIYSYNHVLKSVNMANATFIGEISNGMKSMFYKCDSLKNVILPSSTFAGKISLYETFYYCYKLTSIENLDKLQNISNLYSTFERCNELDNVKFSDKTNKNSVSVSYAFELCYKLDTIDLSAFTNITGLDYAFYDCINLKSLTFASANNVNHVGFHLIFSGCSKLSTIKNLDKFTNLYDFRRSFNNCNSLAKIELGTDPNSKSANQFSSNSWTSSESAYDNTFDNCNAIKYLPAKVTTIPENWKSYNNFVMPIDSVVVTGKGMIMNSGNAIMPAFTTYPSYVVATDTIWQLSADGFKTVIDYNANTQVDFSMYALRCGVKNQSMSDYVYSKNDVQFEKIECYVKAYIAGGVKTYVPNVGTLAKADSVFLFGKWNDNFVQKFAKSLKTSWNAPSSESFSGNNVTNSILKKVDMSDLTHTDTIFYGSLCIFHNCEELETVILPQQQLAKWGFGLYGAFNGCTKLKNVINLDKIKTYSIEGAFLNCTSLESVTFCKDPITDGNYKLTSIFNGCTNLKQVNNFESFVNVSNIYSTFENCESLKEIHLGFDPNESYENNINMSYTFYNCNAIKYLPDGVNDIPETWKYYNNFVIPFSLSANAPEYANNQLSLTCPSQTPSYAAMTDVVWRINNDKFATYDTYSMTNTLSPEIAAENPDYEIYDNPLNGDFTGYMLMCIAYNPKYNTRYYYEITDNGTVQFIADIDEPEIEEFSIYPNPATTSFQINVGDQEAEVCIFNAIGNMVVKQQVFDTETIDISKLPQGIYYVKVGNQVTRLTKM